ncbi:MAG: 3D domain-containing protein [Verrucomicrobia bacterium]|nr:3D domain-containing protein [Verrucomicrobiota bacterium]MBV9129820.1 3D domain-containing protein [Verrucomicrobiota bacterium]MBV9297674.1 3D domain-containing protein [Verrucomicrobiota bacterium]
MKLRVVRLVTCATLSILFVGCAGRSLPEYEDPLPRSQFMVVRTTAYTHTESDHRPYRNSSAAGTTLDSGPVRSAAADWARWPAGTIFLILATGRLYQVDDYGWALSGRNTIDLYCPSSAEMNDWGVRRVTIQILKWGDPWKSYHILRPRREYAHVRRMLDEIHNFY